MAATATPAPVSITIEKAKEILSEDERATADLTAQTFANLHDVMRSIIAERRAAANSIVSLHQSVMLLDARLAECEKEKADLIAQLDTERAQRDDASRDVKATGQRGSSR